MSPWACGAGGLLERESELGLIAEAIQAVRGGAGRSMLVEAEPGLGKTSLLRTAAEDVAAGGMAVSRARGSELERDFAYGIARQLFEPAVRGAVAGERDALFAGAARPARALLLGDVAGDGASDPFALWHALYWLLWNLSASTPCALLLDDAHLADQASVGFLQFLVGRLTDMPVLVLVSARVGDEGLDPSLRAAIEAAGAPIRLTALSVTAAGELARDRLGQEPDRAFVETCHAATGGNPFLLSELLRELAAEGVPPDRDQVARVGRAGPERVARSVMRRLERLPAGAAAVARALCALGDDAQVPVVAALARLERDAALDALASLTRASILEDSLPPRFRHPIVRAAIYASLTAAEQSDLHGRAARVAAEAGAQPEQLAAHLVRAGPEADPWAVATLRTAAARARARGAAAAAVGYLERALAEPAGEDRHAVLRELGTAEFFAGRPGAIDRLREALQLSPTLEDRAAATRALAPILVAAGRTPEAVAALERAVSDAEATGSPVAGDLRADLSSIALLDSSAADRIMRPLERVALRDPQTPAERILVANLSEWLGITGAGAAQAAAVASRALSGDRLLVEAGPEALALYHATYVLIAAERFAEADDVLARAVEASRRLGSIVGFSAASLMRSVSAYRQGNLIDAEADARNATGAFREIGLPLGLPVAVGHLIDVLVERGELAEAQRTIDDLDLDGEIPDQFLYQGVLVARGRLRLARGRLEMGVEDLLEWGRRADRSHNSNTVGTPTHRTYLAPPLAVLGRHQEAISLAREEIARARNWGTARSIGTALHAQGLAEGGSRGVQRLAEAIRTLDGSAAKLDLARALVDHGGALRRLRRPAEARVSLGRGLELATACGAAALADRAYGELAATGVRRLRRTMLRGVDALTPSERRICAMARDGMTNREIAQALFLTPKTIEMHLHNAYRKLGIESRGGLAAVLDRDGQLSGALAGAT